MCSEQILNECQQHFRTDVAGFWSPGCAQIGRKGNPWASHISLLQLEAQADLYQSVSIMFRDVFWFPRISVYAWDHVNVMFVRNRPCPSGFRRPSEGPNMAGPFVAPTRRNSSTSNLITQKVSRQDSPGRAQFDHFSKVLKEEKTRNRHQTTFKETFPLGFCFPSTERHQVLRLLCWKPPDLPRPVRCCLVFVASG